MKTDFIQTQLKLYDLNKGTQQKMLGDETDIAAIKKKFPATASDHELNPEELFALFSIMHNGNRKRSEASKSFFQNLETEHGKPSFSTAVKNLQEAKLLTQSNFNILSQFSDDMLTRFSQHWIKLHVSLRTQQNFDSLCRAIVYLENLSGKDSITIFSSTRINQEKFDYATSPEALITQQKNYLIGHLTNNPADPISYSLQRALLCLPVNLITKNIFKQLQAVENISKDPESTETLAYLFSRLPSLLQTEENFKNFLSKIIRFSTNTSAVKSDLNDLELVTEAINLLPMTLQNQGNLNKLLNFRGYRIRESVWSAGDKPALGYIVKAFNNLPDTLKTQENFDLLTQGDEKKRAYDASAAVSILIVFGGLPDALQTKENFGALMEQKHLFSAEHLYEANVLSEISEIFFTQDFFNQLIENLKNEGIKGLYTSANPIISIDNGYVSLPEDLQTFENYNTIQLLFNPDTINVGVQQRWSKPNLKLNDAFELTAMMRALPRELRVQNNFDTLVENIEAIRNIEVRPMLSYFPYHLFTQAVFNHIIEVCATVEAGANVNEVKRQLQEYINDRPNVLDPRANANLPRANANRPPANAFAGLALDRQNTHIASVHETVSQSALALWRSYGDKISNQKNLNAVIASITPQKFDKVVNDIFSKKNKKEEAKSDDTKKQLIFEAEKAKLEIHHLADPTYAFTDPTSDISTRQMLALTWLAVNDNSKRSCSENEAIKKFITALYDIRRGYNLDENFKEINKESKDSPICTAGTFNKLTEIGWGIHPDVKIVVVTSTTASAKLQIVIKEEALNYLTQLQSEANTSEKQKEFKELVETINKGGLLDPIWEKIMPIISKKLFDEFKILFKTEDNKDFKALIENGAYFGVAQLNLDKKFLKKEPANQAFFTQDKKYEEEKEQDEIKKEAKIIPINRGHH